MATKKPQVMETLRALRYVQEMIQSQEEMLLQQSTPNTRKEALRQLTFREGGDERDLTISTIMSGSARPAASPSVSPTPSQAGSDNDYTTPMLHISSSPPATTQIEGEQDGNNTLLQSTSSFLPVLNNSAGSLSAPPTGTFSSLTSSLSRAYGYPVNSDSVIQLSDILLGTEDRTTSSGREGPSEGVHQQRITVKELSPLVVEDAEIVKAVIVIQAAVRGYLCRRQDLLVKHRAATVLQAAWRGYRARRKDPAVLSVLGHLYRKKTENYITLLVSQLMCCREELAHQAHMQQIQDETMQSLMKEVEELQQWRAEQVKEKRQQAARTIQRHWRCHKSCQNQTSSLPAATASLTWNCLSLQKKVTSLEEQVTKLSKCIAKPSLISLPPPVDLQMEHFSHTCLLIHWSSPPNADPDTINSYRVYVNDLPEGMVSRNKHKAYIEGLDIAVSYRITVRAQYINDMESIDSNAVIASLAAGPTTSEGLPPAQDQTLPLEEESTIKPHPLSLSFTSKEDEDPLSLDAASVELPTISLPNKENEDPLSLVAACSASVELPATNKENDEHIFDGPTQFSNTGRFPSIILYPNKDLLENAEHLLSGAPASYTTGNRLPDDISPYSFTSTEDYHNSASVELPSITVPSKDVDDPLPDAAAQASSRRIVFSPRNENHLLSGAPGSYITSNRLPDDISPSSIISISSEDDHDSSPDVKQSSSMPPSHDVPPPKKDECDD